MRETRSAVEKAELQYIEANKPCERRQRKMHCARLAAVRMQRRGLQRRIAVLLRDIGFERFRRCMHQVTGKALDRTVRNNTFMDDVVGPMRAPPSKQADRPIWIAFAVRKPAADKAIAPRDRLGARGWRSCGKE